MANTKPTAVAIKNAIVRSTCLSYGDLTIERDGDTVRVFKHKDTPLATITPRAGVFDVVVFEAPFGCGKEHASTCRTLALVGESVGIWWR